MSEQDERIVIYSILIGICLCCCLCHLYGCVYERREEQIEQIREQIEEVGEAGAVF